ncbi:hypothetical protein [Burkholderia sp. IMCC1007]|uniref:hypothetical protein n=1 Tax=Burkholderia sp. IMCC1007 TaxID=3004104 RepID=UPI0022B4A08E|nr:hypothetical protein [Burkholderia sp. IMCC1007]
MRVKDANKELAAKMFYNQLPEEVRTLLGARIESANDALTQGVIDWGFEVMKHLAIFNGAGLAGASAIAQAYSNDPTVHTVALQAVHLFVAGLMVALVTMVASYLIAFLCLFKLPLRWAEVLLNRKPLGHLRVPTRYLIGSGIVWILSATSIVLFFLGALKVVKIA